MSLVSNADQHPLLMEYVDCLHFILSIGLDIGAKERFFAWHDETPKKNVITLFSYLYRCTNSISRNGKISKESWEHLMFDFIELARSLGFTWQQIESAYFNKNEINHERQSNGY